MRDALGRIDTLALIGGQSAIGRAIASALVEERQASSVVLAVREPRDDDGADLAARGARIRTIKLDLQDLDHHTAAVDDMFSEGTLDVVVLAAGVLGDQAQSEGNPADAVNVMITNYVGPAHLLLHVAERLRNQGSGTLVVLSSIAAVQARRSNFIYGSAKAGLDTFTRGLSDLLDGTGARAIVIRPGFVRTPMTAGLDEAPFAQNPDEIAAAVLRALDRSTTTAFTSLPVGLLGRLLAVLPRPVLRRLP